MPQSGLVRFSRQIPWTWNRTIGPVQLVWSGQTSGLNQEPQIAYIFSNVLMSECYSKAGISLLTSESANSSTSVEKWALACSDAQIWPLWYLLLRIWRLQKSLQSVCVGEQWLLVMYQAWLRLKALAWAWLWWAWGFEILSHARIEGLPKPWAWLRLKPGLVYQIWL